MATYLDGMDGGKHNSEETEATGRSIIEANAHVNVPEFIRNINWKLLREQKLDLLYVISKLELDALHANNIGATKTFDKYIRFSNSLEGILNLIDSLQEYVVDELGMDENDVFLLNQEE